MQLPGAVRFRLEAWLEVHGQGGFNMPHVHANRLLTAAQPGAGWSSSLNRTRTPRRALPSASTRSRPELPWR